MKTIRETQFRDMYHQICFIKADDNMKMLMKKTLFPGDDTANGVLAYGYIDPDWGFTFEVLAMATSNDEGVSAFSGTDATAMKWGIESVFDREAIVLQGADTSEYQNKIDVINSYFTVSVDVNITRQLKSLDAFRSPKHPDDIKVILEKDGIESEPCYARCYKYSENVITACLVSDPNPEFEMAAGDLVDCTFNGKFWLAKEVW